MNTKTVLLSNKVYEYEWIIQLSYYFHVIQLYKNLLSKPKIVIKFAKYAIDFIKRQINRAEQNASRSCSSTVDMKLVMKMMMMMMRIMIALCIAS